MTQTSVDSVAVAIIDHHEVVRRGLRAELMLADHAFCLCGEFSSVDAFLAAEHEADVVVLDLNLGGASALPWIKQLVECGYRVMIYTDEQRPVPLRAAVHAGVAGVLLKADPLGTVTAAIRRAAAGEFVVSSPLAAALIADPARVTALSEQQVQVLRWIDAGLDLRGVARTQNIGMGTVKEHLARVRAKYRAKGIEAGNSHHLTRMARDEGHL